MDKLGEWISASFRHLGARWQAHIVPVLVLIAAIIVLSSVAMGLFFVVWMFGSVIAVAIGTLLAQVNEGLGMAAMGIISILVYLISFLVIFVCMALIVPVQLGYMRGSMNLMRGGEFTVGDLFSAFRLTLKGFIAMFLMMTAVMIAMCFCYFPAFLVSAALIFTFPFIVDPQRNMGPIAAMKASYDLGRPYFWGLVLYVFLIGTISGILGYIPFIGPLISIPVATTMLLTPYLDLVDGPAAYPEPGAESAYPEYAQPTPPPQSYPG